MVRRSSKKLTKKQERIRNAFETERTVEVIPAVVQNAVQLLDVRTGRPVVANVKFGSVTTVIR
jgi:hypothetical protein